MRRVLKRYWWVVAILILLLTPVAWYLGSPLFLNKAVDEPFPGSTCRVLHEQRGHSRMAT
jgi:4-amino-4-deoxy-L-arabinose transferase-like glycosyltransferase